MGDKNLVERKLMTPEEFEEYVKELKRHNNSLREKENKVKSHGESRGHKTNSD